MNAKPKTKRIAPKQDDLYFTDKAKQMAIGKVDLLELLLWRKLLASMTPEQREMLNVYNLLNDLGIEIQGDKPILCSRIAAVTDQAEMLLTGMKA